MAVPPSVSVSAWSVSNVEPAPVPTVTLEVPAASEITALLTPSDSTGAESSSVMVMVRAVPTSTLLCVAVITTVSASSSILSCTAVMVVAMDEAAVPEPAGSVSDFEPMV